MRRTGTEEEMGDDEEGVNVVKVSDLKSLWAARDEVDGDAADVTLKKKSIKDTAKQLGIIQDAFETVHKLRLKPTAYARDWLEAVNMYAEAAGILDQVDLVHDVPTADAPPPHGQTLN
jgi:hypothetical protein